MVIHFRGRSRPPHHRGAWGLAVTGMILALATVVDAAPAFGPREYVVKPALPLPAIERFPACQPEKGGRLRVENGPDGRARAALAVLVLNQRETVLMLEGPGQRRVVERAVQLVAGNTLLVWMIGPPGATLAVSVTSAGSCLDVAIASPAPGAMVPEGTLGFPARWALGRQGRGQGPKDNQFSLPDARDYQYQSLIASSPAMRDQFTARFFRALGHVFHILEDMAQPQHTRNDPHADCFSALNPLFGGHSWYEEYLEARTLRRPFAQTGNIPPPTTLVGYAPPSIRFYRDFLTDNTRHGLADFSSRNFLSAGTNLAAGSASCAGLPEPPCDATAYQQVSRLYLHNDTLRAPCQLQ